MVSPWVPILIAMMAFFGKALILPSVRDWRENRRLARVKKPLVSFAKSPPRPLAGATLTQILPSSAIPLSHNALLTNDEYKVVYHMIMSPSGQLESLGFMSMEQEDLCHFPFINGRLTTCHCQGNELSQALPYEIQAELEQLLACIRKTFDEQCVPRTKPPVDLTVN